MTWLTDIFSSTNKDLADPSEVKTLMNIFLMLASLIFSMANLIFSALSLASCSSGVEVAEDIPLLDWMPLDLQSKDIFFR